MSDALTYAELARRMRELEPLVKDKAYRAFPPGGEARRFLQSLRVEGKSANTLISYESVLFPKTSRLRPFSDAGVHNWFARCLERADLPHFPMHALRHAAIDEVRRSTGNIEAARQLARHESIATTEAYLHADTADLIAEIRKVEAARGGEPGSV